MKVLVIGSGAREHAIAWKIAQSKLVKKIFVAPGNAGTQLDEMLQNVAINSNDINALAKFAQYKKIDLTIVGPETPLILGIVDIFRKFNLNIFGPTKYASQLEGSKTFAKKFLIRHNIPTSKYKSFFNSESALKYLHEKGVPIVIKRDGLYAGKGVIVAKTIQEAEYAIKNIFSNSLPNINNIDNHIVIEEFINGIEISFIVMVDGINVLPMAISKDYKRLKNGDIGPNTGGMGAYSSELLITNEMKQRIIDTIIFPTVYGMALEGYPYTGFLYAGLMINEFNEPIVIEFNCRSGDPETQPIMLRLKSDFLDIILAACEKKLNKKKIEWNSNPSISVVLANDGYPNHYNTGNKIYGLPIINKEDNVQIFHAGTRIDENNEIVTNGGRVLSITALGDNLAITKQRVYEIVKKISWDGKIYRTDIGDITV